MKPIPLWKHTCPPQGLEQRTPKSFFPPCLPSCPHLAFLLFSVQLLPPSLSADGAGAVIKRGLREDELCHSCLSHFPTRDIRGLDGPLALRIQSIVAAVTAS